MMSRFTYYSRVQMSTISIRIKPDQWAPTCAAALAFLETAFLPSQVRKRSQVGRSGRDEKGEQTLKEEQSGRLEAQRGAETNGTIDLEFTYQYIYIYIFYFYFLFFTFFFCVVTCRRSCKTNLIQARPRLSLQQAPKKTSTYRSAARDTLSDTTATTTPPFSPMERVRIHYSKQNMLQQGKQ